MTATITIKSEPLTRMQPTKNGPRQVHFQNAQLETSELRMQIEIEIDGPNVGYVKDKQYAWDLERDVRPGTYGPELARRYTLIDAKPAAAKP